MVRSDNEGLDGDVALKGGEQWKSRSWVGKVAKCGGVKPIMGSQNTLFLLSQKRHEYYIYNLK
jgi:hypothetical protein